MTKILVTIQNLHLLDHKNQSNNLARFSVLPLDQSHPTRRTLEESNPGNMKHVNPPKKTYRTTS